MCNNVCICPSTPVQFLFITKLSLHEEVGCGWGAHLLQPCCDFFEMASQGLVWQNITSPSFYWAVQLFTRLRGFSLMSAAVVHSAQLWGVKSIYKLINQDCLTMSIMPSSVTDSCDLRIIRYNLSCSLFQTKDAINLDSFPYWSFIYHPR